MRGIIETVNIAAAYGFIRDESWRRLFFVRDDLADGFAEPGATVEFDVDEDSDARGPRACQVRVTAPPAEAVQCSCRDCGAAFILDAGAQAWHQVHGLPLPKRCRGCREARRAARAR